MFGIGSDLQEGLGRGAKRYAVNYTLVHQNLDRHVMRCAFFGSAPTLIVNLGSGDMAVA